MSRPRARRRRPGAAARLRPFWFLLAFVLAIVAFGAYWFATWPALDPHTIDVSGNQVVSKDSIVEAARIDVRRNIWLQNTGAMARRVMAIPYVDTASVHRAPPSTVRIMVTERAPFAVVRTPHGDLVVDRALRVLQRQNGASTLPSIVVSNVASYAPGAFLDEASLRTLRDDLEKLLDAHVDIASLTYDRLGDVDGTLQDGVRVLFGDEDGFEKKIALVNPILAQVGRNRRPIAAIDVRAVGTPIVEYKK